MLKVNQPVVISKWHNVAQFRLCHVLKFDGFYRVRVSILSIQVGGLAERKKE